MDEPHMARLLATLSGQPRSPQRNPLSPQPSSDRIVWLDLEFCSLKDHRVLECAVIITTCNALREVARKNWIIGMTPEQIDRLVIGGAAATFHAAHSLQNGLVDACLASETTYEQWQRELFEFLTTHCFSGCRLAGFSPHVDREVLRTQAKNVYEFLDHKIIDISSLDIVQWGLPALERAARRQNWSPSSHRAMSDCEDAIAKLKWYQSWLRDHMRDDTTSHDGVTQLYTL
ncbi:K13288 oligoribonuclease [Seminavis robusta]|uniref:K13288 oligoribonuclease n=1 Tax=Seminavis robusta TaxID=568900 RepID=A0A9N8HLZ3_9STRA|nr:K13288 oligoribonuclease [Seminavis robusta]|eukprot:Sro865_g212800.1 K13288 oligoribonuclease EC 3.1 (231) ;mRNA; f:13280-13972